jgi:hypothetical protein
VVVRRHGVRGAFTIPTKTTERYHSFYLQVYSMYSITTVLVQVLGILYYLLELQVLYSTVMVHVPFRDSVDSILCVGSLIIAGLLYTVLEYVDGPIKGSSGFTSMVSSLAS